VNRLLATLGRFLREEEVPRWFGLTVVLIYLVGLGAVARFGIVQAKQESTEFFQQGHDYAVRLLAERIRSLDDDVPGDERWTRTCQRLLKDFATNVPTRSARVIGNRKFLASLDPADVGRAAGERKSAESRWDGLDVATLPPADGQPEMRWVRVSVPVRRGETHAEFAASESESTGEETPETAPASIDVEVVLPMAPVDGHSLAAYASMLSIALVVLGALFVAYRCLREQLRGVSRIANRLELHRDRIEDNLGLLRISDQLDGVTRTWNDLIDLTERLRSAVQRTEANEELCRVLQKSGGGGAIAEAVNALPDAFVYVAEETRFEFLNTAACRLFGWSPTDAKRMTLNDAASNGAGGKALELLRAAAQSEGGFEPRSEIVTVDDGLNRGTSSYRVSVIPVPGTRHQGSCVMIARDVSQQIRAEKAHEEFIAQVTHELRTPLTNIRAYTETLSSGMFEDPKVTAECYNVITKETRRLSRLVEDILSVSQLEVGTIDLKIDQVDLKSLLSEGVRDVRGIAEEKNIDVQLVLPAKLEPIRADRDKLAVVVINLLGNAIKYTPPNGNVVVGCQMAASSVMITVKDNGIGIDASELAKVFEKFQRGSNPEVQKESGTGIGLFTAREIARRHGGDIELISEKGKGSTFMVRLPHVESRASAMSTVS